MGQVRICLPYAYSGKQRDELHRWVISKWLPVKERNGWSISWAMDRARQSEDEPPRTTDTFNHARAINNSVTAFTGGLTGTDDDILVICDADTFPDLSTLEERIEAAREGWWSVPALYVNLSEETTARVLKTRSFEEGVIEAHTPPINHVWSGDTSWSGVVVIRRDQFHGYDERFTGWSADDIAFAMMTETLERPALRTGNVFHLYHDAPRSQTYDRPGFDKSWALTRRYMDALGDEKTMRELLAEREVR